MTLKPFALTALLATTMLSACAPSAKKQAEMAAAAEPFLTAPLIIVQLPAQQANAVLRPVAQNGPVTTWQTVDGITLSFSDGVLVASRGLGFDLMGADAAPTRAGLAGQAPDIYRRKLRYLTGDNHSTWLTAGCSMRAAGTEDGLRRFEESCTARTNTFTNVFMLDSGGRVVTSQQWLSPEIGYVEIGPFSLPANVAHLATAG